MKEKKIGKKPHGMVLVISVGKPGGKKPEREADPDTKKKASVDELQQEAASLREMGDKKTARRFSDVAGLMERGPALRESSIQRLGTQAAEKLGWDEEEQEGIGRTMFEQGRNSPDYEDLRAGHYPPEVKRAVMQLISQMARQGAQADNMDERAQSSLDELREEDPTQFFADKDYVRRSYENLEALDAMMKGELVNFCTCCSPADIAWAITKAKKKSKPFHGYNPNRHHKKGGLNAKGRAKFKRETGANLKPPVTKKPSKLKPGSKSAKRRKSFCARMSGSKGPTSKKGKLTPKGAALKRWNC